MFKLLIAMLSCIFVISHVQSAEIIIRHENLRLAIGRLVEDKIRVLGSVVAIAHAAEQRHAQSGALDRFQIIRRNDHIGIDIDRRHRCGDAGKGGEFIHDFILSETSHATVRRQRQAGVW